LDEKTRSAYIFSTDKRLIRRLEYSIEINDMLQK
jgi:hypothetical protein